MSGHFLTQVFNPVLPKFSYFNINNFTLKRLLILAALIFPAFAAIAQSHDNIEFIENKGQWDSQVQFKGNVSNGAIFVRSGGFTVVQHNPSDYAGVSQFLHGLNADGTPVRSTDKFVVRSHAWNVDFVGASSDIKTVADKVIPTYNNYFVGNDQSKWGSSCRIYQAITMKDVYPNIDVRYYTDNNFLKYDIIVKPGGDVSKIALRYNGIDKIQVKNKELAISTSVGEMKESSPYTYQSSASGKNEINCKYVIKDNILKFDVKNYDPTATLIIDPIVIFCSFSGSTAESWGFTATYGADGSMYAGGIVFGTGFPTSPGAFQTTYQGGGGGAGNGIDIGIIKLSSNGVNRIYATYVGGGGDEQPHSLVVNSQGNLIIAGRTNSNNYPVVNPGGQVGPGGGYDIVVTELNATGTGLVGSKKIGGTGDDGVNITSNRAAGTSGLMRNYGDDGRSEVIVDGAGNVYVASSTQSTGSTPANNFPAIGSPFQSVPGGLQDGVVIKLTPSLSAVTFSSYLGGSEADAAYVISLSPAGDIYVGGGTESNNFFGNHAGTVGPSNHLDASSNPTIDGFVARINNTGTTLIKSTYIGTSAIDQVFGIQFDLNGFPYIMGQTTGSWPIINAAYSNAGGKQFICKLQPDLSSYVYSTAFGSGASTPNISPIAFLVDRCQNVYISGWGGHFFNNNNFSSAGTDGLPVTPDAIKGTTDGKDFYFFVLKRDATSQLFGSFFGENNTGSNQGSDHVDGGTSRFDPNGVIYQAICGNCDIGSRVTYPTTPGSWATTNNAPSCTITMLKIAMNLSGVAGGVQSAIDGARDTAGCLPLPVIFTDTVGNAQTYEWHFNYVPGGPPDQITTVPTASFTYNAVGTYRVLLVAVDLNTCNQRDSSYINIRVGDLKADLRPAWQPVGPGCPKFTYEFINNSVTDITRPFQDTSFVWDFGDGSPRVPAKIGAVNAVTHIYPALGTYRPKLILKDTAYCNNPDDSTFTISIADNVRAIISTPASGCLQYNAVFKSNSLNGVNFSWDFGDPTSPNNTSILENPTHIYTATGIYTITLTVTNPGTCNITDVTTFTISVLDSPTPDFNFAPIPPVENTPTTFTNLSSADAVRFKWVFGDGDSLLTASRAPVQHQYNATGTFNACLTAYNLIGCDSTICKPVQAIIVPVVDVPNAFTPQSNDQNSVVYVRGFGIAKMQFIIWNRWGQKVFETNNRFQGWDGKVKGAVQPMDVYVYTLSIEFFDGTKTTKKGDITLIR